MIRPSTSARMAAVLVSALALTATLPAGPEGEREWRDYAGGPDSSRFVAAKQITSTNVNQLQVACACHRVLAPPAITAIAATSDVAISARCLLTYFLTRYDTLSGTAMTGRPFR